MNDIAIVRLASKLDLDESVNTICLPEGSEEADKDGTVRVAGRYT